MIFDQGENQYNGITGSLLTSEVGATRHTHPKKKKKESLWNILDYQLSICIYLVKINNKKTSLWPYVLHVILKILKNLLAM